MIEMKGAVTGLITTEGFRDALEIGRERKYELYDINIAKPNPLDAIISTGASRSAALRGTGLGH